MAATVSGCIELYNKQLQKTFQTLFLPFIKFINAAPAIELSLAPNLTKASLQLNQHSGKLYYRFNLKNS